MNEQWAIAIGTIVLACVALFQSHLHSWLKTPKLEVSTGSVFPYCLRLLFKKKDNPELKANGYGLRIVIRNSKPKCRISACGLPHVGQVDHIISKTDLNFVINCDIFCHAKEEFPTVCHKPTPWHLLP